MLLGVFVHQPPYVVDSFVNFISAENVISGVPAPMAGDKLGPSF